MKSEKNNKTLSDTVSSLQFQNMSIQEQYYFIKTTHSQCASKITKLDSEIHQLKEKIKSNKLI